MLMRLLVPPLFLSVLLLGVSGPTVLRAQTVKPVKVATDTVTFVTPLLIDENGEPMVGLTLINRNQKISKTTDANGSCSLAGAKNEVLEVRALGSLVNTYVLSDDRFPTITVSTKHPAVQRLKPVRLLNNTQMQSDLTAASTQTVYNNDLTKMPVASFLNALPGRFAGLGSIQGSGEPGSDGTALSLRNQGPLVVIDGIPRNITVFDLEEIESVTVLKDALATAMLGVRSSNGVLLVNTRKGFASRPRISFTAQTAVQQPLRQPKTLGSYDYARLYNEALTNDGLPEAYTQQDLEGYRSRSDPFRYPDVDWRKQVLKPSSRMDRYTFSASGGNSFSRYFVSLEHLNQTGLLRTSDINTYNTNNDFKVYTVRSNVDLNLNSKLSAGIHLFGRILNSNDAGYVIPNTNTTGTSSIFSALINTPNNAYPIYNPNGTYGGTTQFQNNIWAQAIGSGYRQNYQRDMLADFYLKRTLDEVTKGLWIRATGSYYATLSENIARNKTFAVFQQTAADVYQQFGVNGDQANNNGIDFQSRADYLELALGYDRAFGQHGIQAIVLGNRDNAVGGSDLPYTITGTSGRFSYNYSGKYIAEASFAVNGSNRYPEDGRTRVGFFPAFGLGWNLSKEEFMKSLTWLTHLKAFASVGKTGNDRPGYFRYIQTYFDSPSVFLVPERVLIRRLPSNPWPITISPGKKQTNSMPDFRVVCGRTDWALLWNITK
ncbi:hypothetical protein BWI97_25270 [Siphonobacter sp. BAB-5405]|nr:hypothetical protein BWI97_25270 [Siphonobacter sp. BAB-5405]